MMMRYAMFAVFCGALATQVPAIVEAYQETSSTSGEVQQYSSNSSRQKVKVTSGRNPLAGRVAKLKSDRSGHYIVKARLNGKPTEVLVDTGATVVSMNEFTARRLGIRLRNDDYKYKSKTANGVKKIALTKLDEVRIGRVIVHDVQAAVSKGKGLDTVLLGMSFLKRLKKFEFEGGTLVLTQ